MARSARLIVPLVLAFLCAACKEYKDITVDISDGQVVFLLPELPRLGTLYVEALNTESDAFEIVWSISFDSGPGDVPRTITYGSAPTGAKIDTMSTPQALKAGLLYAVGMDVGPIVAKGMFVIEGGGTARKVRNLTYQEANELRKKESRRKAM